jgi:DNA-binding transcriptional regulator YdaS (Cro superfamily)
MCNLKNVKATTRHLVQRVGGPKAAAQICGVSETLVGRWCDDDYPRSIPVHRMIDLDAAGGDVFLKDLSHSRNYDLTAREPQQSEATSIVGLIGKFSRATGEFEYTVLEAAEDHALTANEKRRIRDRLAPVKDLIAQTEAAIS